MRCVRADSDFFAEQLLECLEVRFLPYVIVARMSRNRLFGKSCGEILRIWLDGGMKDTEFFERALGLREP